MAKKNTLVPVPAFPPAPVLDAPPLEARDFGNRVTVPSRTNPLAESLLGEAFNGYTLDMAELATGFYRRFAAEERSGLHSTEGLLRIRTKLRDEALTKAVERRDGMLQLIKQTKEKHAVNVPTFVKPFRVSSDQQLQQHFTLQEIRGQLRAIGEESERVDILYAAARAGDVLILASVDTDPLKAVRPLVPAEPMAEARKMLVAWANPMKWHAAEALDAAAHDITMTFRRFGDALGAGEPTPKNGPLGKAVEQLTGATAG